MEQAITYVLNQWVALTQCLKGGRFEMTNNAVESREHGGKTAVQMSLLTTAQAAGVHPGDYFKDVLLRSSEPGTDLKSLPPHG